MKFINQNAPAIGVMLPLVSMVVGVTAWVVTEINDVRDDLHDTEMRLTEKIDENAAGIAQINARLDRIEHTLDAVLEAIANHSHSEDGSPVFTRPTAQENSADAESENHQCFAPYFTEECATPGISMISRVLHIVPYQVDALLSKQIELPDTPSQLHHHNWQLGLSAVRARAKSEEWRPADTGRLFYLDRPETFRTPALTKTIYNDTDPPKKLGPSRIPRGFTLKYDELLTKSSWSLENPPC